MRSGWTSDATEVYSVSGIRDHVYKHHPTHFWLIKGGDFLVGTASLFRDDGFPFPSWGNVVAIGNDWADRWQANMYHPRGLEYSVINRFSDATGGYMERDRRLAGYQPAERGFGGGLDLHGHTQSAFFQEGELVAYETWPRFDYAAGDATNSWLTSEAAEVYRQLVFLKPDTVVVYDRVKLGPEAKTTRWLAATGPVLSSEGSRFAIRSGDARAEGLVLLPERAAIHTYRGLDRYPKLFWEGQSVDQHVLEIEPATSAAEVEYFVVLRVGEKELAPVAARLVQDDGLVGAELDLGDGKARVLFRRQGPLGGRLSLLPEDGKSFEHELASGVDDTYRHWSADPRYQMWTTDPRFEHFVLGRDRTR